MRSTRDEKPVHDPLWVGLSYMCRMANLLTSTKRRIARRLLAMIYSAAFLRKRALAVLVRSYANSDVALRVKLPGHSLMLDPADDVITPRILMRGSWQRKELEHAIAVIAEYAPESRGKLFIDVGANIGTQTVYAMLTGYFGGGMAFEPAPRNFALLNENIEINGFAHQVMTRQCGIGSAKGKATLSLSGWNGGGHAIARNSRISSRNRAAQIEIEIATLTELLSHAERKPSDIGLVWIDVEGGERDVLRGMAEILHCGTPVVIEHLPELITADAAADVRGILARHYRYFCRLGNGDPRLEPVEAFDALRMSGDFLFLGRRTPQDGRLASPPPLF